ncbi:tetratricopeptide repeat protein [Rhodocyclaceae bacterium]
MTIAIAKLRQLANAARFDEFLAACMQQMESAWDDAPTLLDIGSLLLAFGYLTLARRCFEQAGMLLPDDPGPAINLANVAMEAGEHEAVRALYARLTTRWPNQATLHRNALNSQAYDPTSDTATYLAAARTWGLRALGRSGGVLPRPPLRALNGRPLRVGYVSADFCGHTVGYLIRPVLATHDPQRVCAFAYAQIKQDDGITDAIRAVTQFRDITALDPKALARQIEDDRIDVLVDLSGHTAGSRLLSFVYRPAPVMVSWLGYYATTGLSLLDAVLLDEWHAPPGTEEQFVEPILRLPTGRFCYAPPEFMPRAAPPSSVKHGHVRFGCFNNTAKLTDAVFDLWAEILRQVPDSRLILKWRTLQDAALRDKILAAFVRRGIAAARIELRGASFHRALLEEYGEIDIALDPFPFTGGMTSCEALFMGVPVVTWPQARVVSRQTWAFLNQIGHPELAAQDAADYVRIAVTLAGDTHRRIRLRRTLRQQMLASPLCDVAGFTRSLEAALVGLYERIAHNVALEKEKTMPKIKIDNREYDTDSLSDVARQNLQMLQMTEQEIQRLQMQLAIAQTARNAFANALKQNLPATAEQAMGETMKFG